MSNTQKIAFIYMDDIHHIGHFASVAVELSKTQKVHILTYPAKHDFLHKTLARLGGEKVRVEKLPTNFFRAFTDKLKKRKMPRNGFWFNRNKKYILKNFDALVFVDYIHRDLLKARKDREKPKFIKLQHGAPGRGYSYNPELIDFDFQLLYGPYHLEALQKKRLLAKDFAVAGYPKMDTVDPRRRSYFPNDNPVVLYNPHFAIPLSSWHEMGIEILDHFFSQNDYNLIFAPHINLFRTKKGKKPPHLPEKYRDAKNIFIDLGSEASVTMDYITSAEIYLGDVSSQVFEFIIKPRPCIFVNAQKIDFGKNIDYRFWQCGEVIENIDELSKALNNANTNFENCNPIQEKITAENFYTEKGSTASERAAEAIRVFLDNQD